MNMQETLDNIQKGFEDARICRISRKVTPDKTLHEKSEKDVAEPVAIVIFKICRPPYKS